jgi:hypothetical protein
VCAEALFRALLPFTSNFSTHVKNIQGNNAYIFVKNTDFSSTCFILGKNGAF